MDHNLNLSENTFFSPQFNALQALYNTSLQPPIQNARPLDNIYQCRRLLPSDHPDSIQPHLSQPPTTSNAAALSKQRLSYIQQSKERQKQKINPLDEIASKCTTGPLGRLAEWYHQRQIVHLVTRHSSGIRGKAKGTLVAFDKHFNLVLRDVEETYTVLLKIWRQNDHGKGRWCRKQEHRRRRLKQVFVAGNSVVYVGVSNDGQS